MKNVHKILPLFSIVVANPVQALTTSITATADGWVRSSGVLGLSTGDTDTTFSTVRSGGNNVWHGIYEFSLATVPSGAVITAATLKLTTSRFISNVGNNPADISIYGYTGDGAITTADYGDDGNPTPYSAFASLPTGTGSGGTPEGTTISFNLTELASIAAANASAGDFFGLRSQTVNFVDFQVAAIENATYAAPTLEVTYNVPEPSTSALIALGGFSLLLRRKK